LIVPPSRHKIHCRQLNRVPRPHKSIRRLNMLLLDNQYGIHCGADPSRVILVASAALAGLFLLFAQDTRHERPWPCTGNISPISLPDQPSRAGDPLPDPLVTPVDVDVLRQVNMSLTRNLDFCQSGEGSKAWREVLGLREDFKSYLAWVMGLARISWTLSRH